MRRTFVAALTVQLVLALSLMGGCASHAPSSLSPAGVKVWQANEAVVALGTVQTTAISLNRIQVCDPAPCHPLVSDAATGIVIDAVADGVTTIVAVPTGWKGAALGVLDRIQQQLEKAGVTKLTPYIEGARLAIAAI